jgi:hypothetical protein
MKKYLICLVILSFGANIFGQEVTPEQYKEKYPDEKFIRLQDIEKVDISLGRDGLEIEEYNYAEYLYLSNLAASSTARSIRYTQDFYEIDDVTAMVYIPDDGEYKAHKVRDYTRKEVMSDNVFYDGEMAVLYTLPSLPKGSRSSQEYTRIIKDPKFVGSSFFQSGIVIENKVFELKVEKGVNLQIDYFNCKAEDFQYTKETERKYIIHRWAKQNVEKLEMESSAPSMQSVVPHIIYRITDYEHKGETIKVLGGVEDLYSWYSGLVQEAYADENTEINALVKGLVESALNEREKAERIFKWVQKNIKYIAVEDGLGGFKPRNPSTTYTNRYGDCKDMSALLVNMLNEAGLSGMYTWIGTRSIPYSYEMVPTPMSDNHMIACVELDGKYVFLDATSSELPFDYPSQFIQGKEALIYKGASAFDIHKVPAVEASANQNKEVFEIILEDEMIKGKGTSYLSGYHAEYYAQRIHTTKEAKEKKKFFESLTYKGNNKYALKSYENDTSYADKASVEYSFELPNYYYNDGDNIFLNLNLERPFADADLEEDRKLPLEHSYRSNIVRALTFKIPEGYELEYLPENALYEHEFFDYSIQYKQLNEKEVTYELNLTTNFLQLQPEDFEAWNAMIKSLKSDYSESLLLKKI